MLCPRKDEVDVTRGERKQGLRISSFTRVAFLGAALLLFGNATAAEAGTYADVQMGAQTDSFRMWVWEVTSFMPRTEAFRGLNAHIPIQNGMMWNHTATYTNSLGGRTYRVRVEKWNGTAWVVVYDMDKFF